jgi:glycosyltransferase involved in cell wall biosynthesis
LYDKEYGTGFQVIRNVPEVSMPFMDEKQDLRVRLNLPTDKKIIILQGAGINIQRGAEEAVEAMTYLNGAVLLIVGGGDVIDNLKQQVVESGLSNKVIFVAKQPVVSLRKYTAAADLGITLDKDTNINYRFSLPNKLFDYIQAGIPILASNLPEVRRVIETYQVGRISEDHNPKNIAKHIEEMLSDVDANAQWNVNLEKASKELNWEKEKEKLLRIFRAID